MRLGRRGRELRIDGTTASWYDPSLPVTGSVWDALAAPLLLLPPARRRRVLIVGLGGGSAARVVRALAPRAGIVGIERSREVLDAARRWLDLDALGVDVVVDDARRWLAGSRRRFDVVIEDVFVGRGRGVHKPDWLPEPGLELAARRTRAGGLVVSNALDESAAVGRTLRRLFPGVLRLELADYDNRIWVGGPRILSGRGLRAAVDGHGLLAAAAVRISFRRLPAPGPSAARAAAPGRERARGRL